MRKTLKKKNNNNNLSLEQKKLLLDMSGYIKYEKDMALFLSNTINDNLFNFDKDKLNNFVEDFNNMQNKNDLFITRYQITHNPPPSKILVLELKVIFYEKDANHPIPISFLFKNKLQKILRKKSPQKCNLINTEVRNKKLNIYSHITLLYTELAINIYSFVC
jgi:hypothetical protein